MVAQKRDNVPHDLPQYGLRRAAWMNREWAMLSGDPLGCQGVVALGVGTLPEALWSTEFRVFRNPEIRDLDALNLAQCLNLANPVPRSPPMQHLIKASLSVIPSMRGLNITPRSPRCCTRAWAVVASGPSGYRLLDACSEGFYFNPCS